MKIPEIKRTSTHSARRTKKRATGDGIKFSEHLNETSEAPPKSAVSGENIQVSGVNSMLAVQEVSSDPEREARKQLTLWGEDVLDSLDEIRHGLLIGAIPKERLSNLAKTLRKRRENVRDPRLARIIGEIELRAEVELAKLARST